MKTMFVNTYWWWHPVTTPAVVREQCSYVYMYNIDKKSPVAPSDGALLFKRCI